MILETALFITSLVLAWLTLFDPPSNQVPSWEEEVWLAVLGLSNQYMILSELGGRD